MEYVEGIKLKDVIDTSSACRFNVVSNVCQQVCDALEYAHGKHVVHRDIKVLILSGPMTNSVKLADFGLAKILEGSKNSLTSVQGSPVYMSPEQVTGKTLITAPIYTLWEYQYTKWSQDKYLLTKVI